MRRLAESKVPLSPKFYAQMTLILPSMSRGEERNWLLNTKHYNDLVQKQVVLHFQILF